MRYIENIVIGKPIVDEKTMFAIDDNDWEKIEKEKTFWTEQRHLPTLLKELEIVKSASEVRRNKPGLCIKLENLDFLEIKWGKRKLWILVGE